MNSPSPRQTSNGGQSSDYSSSLPSTPVISHKDLNRSSKGDKQDSATPGSVRSATRRRTPRFAVATRLLLLPRLIRLFLFPYRSSEPHTAAGCSLACVGGVHFDVSQSLLNVKFQQKKKKLHASYGSGMNEGTTAVSKYGFLSSS